MTACLKNHSDIAHLLISAGANVDAITDVGCHVSRAGASLTDVVSNRCVQDGWSALLVATSRGHVHAAICCLDAEPNVNAQIQVHSLLPLHSELM